jgi:hypothetical protein
MALPSIWAHSCVCRFKKRPEEVSAWRQAGRIEATTQGASPTGGRIECPTDVPPIKHKLLYSLFPEVLRVRHSLELFILIAINRKEQLRANKTCPTSFKNTLRAQ